MEDGTRSWLIRSQDGRILSVSLAEMFDNTISSNLHTGDTQPGPDKVKLLHTARSAEVEPPRTLSQVWGVQPQLT